MNFWFDVFMRRFPPNVLSLLCLLAGGKSVDSDLVDC
jgi:hypothetical protein